MYFNGRIFYADSRYDKIIKSGKKQLHTATCTLLQPQSSNNTLEPDKLN